MAHVYAEGPWAPGVGLAAIVGKLRREFNQLVVYIETLQPENVVQVWFRADPENLSKRLQAFRVGDFRFDHLDVT